MHLTIDGRDVGDVGIESLAERLAGLAAVPRVEAWLRHPDGPSLCLLKSGDRALLMLLRADGDAGLTSRATERVDDGVLQFSLSNGQVDEYPTAWSVPFEDARRAVEYFWFKAAPAPFLHWHDDAG